MGMMQPMDEEDDAEVVHDWQRSLDRFERLMWPVFKSRGYTKDAAYHYWTINRLINTLEALPFMFVQESKRTDTDDDGESWKQK